MNPALLVDRPKVCVEQREQKHIYPASKYIRVPRDGRPGKERAGAETLYLYMLVQQSLLQESSIDVKVVARFIHGMAPVPNKV